MQKYAFTFVSLVILLASVGIANLGAEEEKGTRLLEADFFKSRLTAGWLGQMAGVGWGAPTEFTYNGKIMPEDKIPAWTPETINQFNQDDIYVEMTFLRTLEQYGFDVDIRQAGIDFAKSQYKLWHANEAGRELLRQGIAPPDSGHPDFNSHTDDLDYQIEADYSGLISPGMPNLVIELGEKFGRLMNYGDGLYGGVFIGGMYAEAYFETDRIKIIRAGLACIPSDSQYAEMVRDMLTWYEEEPNDWKKTWDKVDAKYQKNWDYRRLCCSKNSKKYDLNYNIDAKINGAYVLMGLLYGQGSPEQTILISAQCGQDSDCNPSSAAGILFISLGLEKIPDKFYKALDRTKKFSHTEYTFPELIEVCQKLAEKGIVRSGGKIVQKDGKTFYEIPIRVPEPGAAKRSWEPEPSQKVRFTDGELKKINNE